VPRISGRASSPVRIGKTKRKTSESCGTVRSHFKHSSGLAGQNHFPVAGVIRDAILRRCAAALHGDTNRKFADFIHLCQEAKKSGLQQVLVAHPSVIGDNYDEVVESLSRLAVAGLGLAIAGDEPPRK
jgi:hypothetical protein